MNSCPERHIESTYLNFDLKAGNLRIECGNSRSSLSRVCILIHHTKQKQKPCFCMICAWKGAVGILYL